MKKIAKSAEVCTFKATPPGFKKLTAACTYMRGHTMLGGGREVSIFKCFGENFEPEKPKW